MKNLYHLLIILCLLITINPAWSQTEATAWGNITGIRVDGQLMQFETSVRLVGNDWSSIQSTYKERQRPSYTRDGNRQIIETRMDSLYITKTIEDTGKGSARVDVALTSRADTSFTGAFFSITLPQADYANATVELINPADVSLNGTQPNGQDEYLRIPAEGVRFVAEHRQLEVTMEEPTEIIVRNERWFGGSEHIQVYFAILTDSLTSGQTANKTFTLNATGDIDTSPVTLTLNSEQPGREFAGLGGNFRLQNPNTDPQVIEYCLDNLRVAWGRADMPWYLWHPEEDVDPLEAARNGDINPRVKASMEMAQELYKRDIPVILSAWFPPEWAAVGPLNFQPKNGVFGNPLDSTKMDKIYASITSYIIYLKEQYGVEVEMFSFNESDLGINVRQTAKEHAQLIKGLGAYMASKGLKTKMLLGDTADGNGYNFLNASLADSATYPYIDAVSFHSWRGWADTTFTKWHQAAEKLDVPLIVGEGSIDAAAWRYPAIFEEYTYAMEEINLYTRILAICQPLTILQWQLTADYSPLVGGGIFGNDEELRPTQRFWNLKQLASTPENVFAMPIRSDKEDVTCAALGNNRTGDYAIHLVNNGPTRQATLTGLPRKVKSLQLYVTDNERNMQKSDVIKVKDGQAQFTLDEVSYTSLMSGE
uniref:Uncharacterized protein n=1 Tax=Roseihalotalea indica TaxID=2867963 RepID=A0AA49GS85_9BACT|nr:hypothetical protein K4G66_03715 [Tunicatimonas sp. TK19036]